MKGGTAVLIVFLVCIIVLVLYIFVGRNQMQASITSLRAQDEALDVDLEQIRLKEQDIPRLREELPVWSSKLALYEQAIPSEIDDHVFLENLADEIDRHNLKLITIDTTIGESWLGPITEEMEAELAQLGINANAARGVKVAFYSITVVGDFDDTLAAFEGLKRHARLYTIDLVTGPASARAGSISATRNPEQVPLTIAGKLYYGVSKEEVSQETLARVFNKAIASPAARSIFNGVKNEAEEVPAPEAEAAEESEVNGENGGSASAADDRVVASATGNSQEGWLR